MLHAFRYFIFCRAGKKAQGRTWTDLLKDETDEELLEYYGSAELVMVDLKQPEQWTSIAPPRLYTE
jgi:hypothetical protein